MQILLTGKAFYIFEVFRKYLPQRLKALTMHKVLFYEDVVNFMTMNLKSKNTFSIKRQTASDQYTN